MLGPLGLRFEGGLIMAVGHRFEGGLIGRFEEGLLGRFGPGFDLRRGAPPSFASRSTSTLASGRTQPGRVGTQYLVRASARE